MIGLCVCWCLPILPITTTFWIHWLFWRSPPGRNNKAILETNVPDIYLSRTTDPIKPPFDCPSLGFAFISPSKSNPTKLSNKVLSRSLIFLAANQNQKANPIGIKLILQKHNKYIYFESKSIFLPPWFTYLFVIKEMYRTTWWWCLGKLFYSVWYFYLVLCMLLTTWDVLTLYVIKHILFYLVFEPSRNKDREFDV